MNWKKIIGWMLVTPAILGIIALIVAVVYLACPLFIAAAFVAMTALGVRMLSSNKKTMGDFFDRVEEFLGGKAENHDDK